MLSLPHPKYHITILTPPNDFILSTVVLKGLGHPIPCCSQLSVVSSYALQMSTYEIWVVPLSFLSVQGFVLVQWDFHPLLSPQPCMSCMLPHSVLEGFRGFKEGTERGEGGKTHSFCTLKFLHCWDSYLALHWMQAYVLPSHLPGR